MQIILLAEKTGLLRCMAKQEPLTVSQIAQLSSYVYFTINNNHTLFFSLKFIDLT